MIRATDHLHTDGTPCAYREGCPCPACCGGGLVYVAVERRWAPCPRGCEPVQLRDLAGNDLTEARA